MRGIRASLAVSAAMNVPPLIMTFWAPWRTWFPLMLEVWQMRRRKEVRTWGAIKPQVDHDVLFTFCQGTQVCTQHSIVTCLLDALNLVQRSADISVQDYHGWKTNSIAVAVCVVGLDYCDYPSHTYPLNSPSITTTETLSQWSCQPSLQAQAGDPESSRILLTSHPVEIPFCTVLAFECYVWFLLTAYTDS